MSEIKWWTQRIDVRELRALAREWKQDGDEDGAELLQILRGKTGRLNFADAGGCNADNATRYILNRAGTEILAEKVTRDEF